MKAVAKNEELEIRSNGKYIRDYLYVKDVVDGYLLLAKNIDKVKGEAFNFGSIYSARVSSSFMFKLYYRLPLSAFCKTDFLSSSKSNNFCL